MKPAIFIDMDGVVADFVGGAAAKIKEMFGYDVPAESSQITEWSWFDKVLTKKEVNKFWRDVRGNPAFWYGLNSLVSFSDMDILKDLSSKYNIRFVTSRVGYPPLVRHYTYKWLDSYGFSVASVAMVEVVGKDCDWEDKAEIARVFNPIIAVEDSPSNILDYKWEGITVIAPDYPYCRDVGADFVSSRPILELGRRLGICPD